MSDKTPGKVPHVLCVVLLTAVGILDAVQDNQVLMWICFGAAIYWAIAAFMDCKNIKSGNDREKEAEDQALLNEYEQYKKEEKKNELESYISRPRRAHFNQNLEVPPL